MFSLQTLSLLTFAVIAAPSAGLHALTAWRLYNDGAVVEQRIEEPAQLGAGRTAVDDLDGNALLWQMAELAYQLLHPVPVVPVLLRQPF